MKNTILAAVFLLGLLVASCKEDEPINNGNILPICNILTPKDSLEFEPVDSLVINVQAKDTDGIVTSVKYYIDNTIRATQVKAPFNLIIKTKDLMIGNHVLKVVACDDKNGNVVDSLRFTVVDPLTNDPIFATFSNGKIPKSWNNNGWKIYSPGVDDNFSIQSNPLGLGSVLTIEKEFSSDGFFEFYDFGVYRGSFSDDMNNIFYIDDAKVTPYFQKIKTVNFLDWMQRVYKVSSGKHKFKWLLSSDSWDRGFCLDAINFAPTTQAPTISTTTATNIKSTDAVAGGNVTFDGYSLVTTRGICLSTTPNPTITNTKIESGQGMGTFSVVLTNLKPQTTYYIRAFATNKLTTSYGNEFTFKTATPALAQLTTTTPTYNSNSAVSGGNITSDGNSTITARGVCWSTSPAPTINDDKTNDGIGSGNFTSNLSNLKPNTTYYLRAYATNVLGTVYGGELTFTTPYFHIGQLYQGGVIAYLDATGQHGFIAAQNDQGANVPWGIPNNQNTTGALSKEIGSGGSNTLKIVQTFGAGNYSAKICYDLVLNGYDDWVLPSYDELNVLRTNQYLIGNFHPSCSAYFCSTEYSVVNYCYAIDLYISDGVAPGFCSEYTTRFRAIRYF